MSKSRVLELIGISAGYGGHSVLRDLSMTVWAGEFVGILGPNGSGKTTLLRTLTQVVPLKCGAIKLFGRALQSLDQRDIAKKVAVVPQHTAVEFPILGLDVVVMGRYPHRDQRLFSGYTKEDRRIATGSLEALGAIHLGPKQANTLSGGEAALLAIGRAITQAPSLLLADEATSSLDPSRKIQVFELFSHLNETRGLTIISVMHDINLAALYCGRLVFLRDGHIVLDGPVRDVLTRENLKAVYEVDVEIVTHPTRGRPQVLMG